MTKRALIVDDCEVLDTALLVKLVSKQSEFVIHTEKNLKRAKNDINKNPPDFILLDYVLGDEEGSDLLEWLNEQDLHIPVIVYSFDVRPHVEKKCLELGAKRFLDKGKMTVGETVDLVIKEIDNLDKNS
ncbi:response regulator [Patescibacteria group bacterium]|nr:response regulator [Patescibacteria group bacterium]MBU2260122.1 response regulator [Patescibacteria group bacterium]